MALLIENGADVHSVSKVRRIDRYWIVLSRTPQMRLCQLQEGRTTLHGSAWEGRDEAVEFLIERGVAVEAVDDVGHPTSKVVLVLQCI
jgi:hypothetical protein